MDHSREKLHIGQNDECSIRIDQEQYIVVDSCSAIMLSANIRSSSGTGIAASTSEQLERIQAFAPLINQTRD